MPTPAPPGGSFAADPLAYRAVFVRHYGQVHRLLAQITRDGAEADDLAQEVFVALHRHQFDPTQSHDVRRWLLRVALNRGLNAVRGRERRSTRERFGLDPEGPPDPESVVAAAASAVRVREVLASLDPRAARLLTLRQLGLSYAELAEVVDVSPGSVGTLLVRAHRAFAAAYAERFGIPPAEEIA